MALNNMIPQYRSPVATYSALRQQRDKQASNAVNMLATGQDMRAQQQKMNLLQSAENREIDQQKLEGMAAVGKYLDQFRTPQEKKAAFDAVRGQMDQYGLPAVPPEVGYEQVAPALEQAKMQVYGEPKGTRRNMLFGGQVVPGIERETGQVVNPQTGEYMPGATLAPSRREEGTPGAFGKTSSQQGKEIVDWENSTVAALNAIDVADNAIQILRQNPESAGVSGDVLQAVNTVTQTVGNLTKMTIGGVSDTFKLKKGGSARTVTREDLSNIYEEELSGFRNSAIYSRELEAMMLDLAVNAAAMKGQTGRALSDTDLKLNMREVGNVTDAVGAERVLRGFIKRTVGHMENLAKVKGFSDTEELRLVRDRMEAFSGGGVPVVTGDEEVDTFVNDAFKGLME